MLKNKPIFVLISILIAIIFVAISVVVSVYNKNKVIVPDNSIEVLSSNDMIKIKTAYEAMGKKEEFLSICSKIELVVANKLLDGTVTNEEQLLQSIENINDILKTSDWSLLSLEFPSYWMGVWEITPKGAVKFTFEDNNMKPDWTNEKTVKKYVK